MALAERRPVNFPETSTPASPSFDPKNFELKKTNPNTSSNGVSQSKEVKPLTPEKSLSPMDLSPSSRSISPDSLIQSDSKASSVSESSPPVHHLPHASKVLVPNGGPMYSKKPKSVSRAPIATGISTTIPVTGEKPRPEQKNDASLQDDVLYAIFLILYEKDPEGLGMTVKQICDTLVDRHPEMATLSTKTSNLVSAKLNAYVKRVEKGDSNLKYALSRDWADASPKRMVYVYRGLLTEDFHLHVKSMMINQKTTDYKKDYINQSSIGKFSNGSGQINDSIPANSTNYQQSQHQSGLLSQPSHQSSLLSNQQEQQPQQRPRRSTMFDLGVTKNTFLDTPVDKANLFVPYYSAPVTASLSGPVNEDAEKESDNELEDFEVFDDEDEDEDVEFKSFNKAKRSKSLSYLTNKKSKILTAAAAAPRVSKNPSQHSPSAAAAAAALHAAAVKSMMMNGNESEETKISQSCPENKKWLSMVRSGFLTQDIGTPEDISLSDLDKFF